ncbi:hypothetical protein GCM10027597_02890 [Saccharopolyspora tripterygii]
MGHPVGGVGKLGVPGAGRLEPVKGLDTADTSVELLAGDTLPGGGPRWPDSGAMSAHPRLPRSTSSGS